MSEFVMVKRELLERVAHWGSVSWPDKEELRAVLAQEAGKVEPVGWFTEDHLTDKSATTYDRETMVAWVIKGWPVTAIYTSPPAPASVVLPEREWGSPYADGWNACLDKVKELNK